MAVSAELASAFLGPGLRAAELKAYAGIWNSAGRHRRGAVGVFAVYLVHANDTRELQAEFGNLGAAASYAIRLADEIDGYRREADSERPEKVDVYFFEQLQISIRIMRGGLLGNKAVPKLRSM
jgi:hypothetical protein